MKNLLLTSTLTAGMITLGSVLAPSETLAMTVVGCSTPTVNTLLSFDLSDNVTNTKNCGYVDPPTNSTNDQGAGGIDINTDLGAGFFGITDWIRNTEYFDNLTAPTGSFDLSGINFDTISDFTEASEILLVLKDGNNVSTLVGYLYDQTQNGSFSIVDNPWGELFGRDKDLSHVSVYYREGADVVPTPAAVLPALFGMGMAAVRKKKVTSDATQDA